MTSWSIAVETRVGDLELAVELHGNSAPVALVGPNASGKTTLLRLVCGALTPTHGEIVLGDTTLFSSERAVDVPIEARQIGYLPQGFGLFPHLKVIDNVAFGLSTWHARGPRSNRHERALRMLESLDCTELAKRMPRHLSGGEQQRVALARALVVEPAMLLLDEPLSALDAGARRRVRTFLAERLRSVGRPAIVVTHDARDVAALGAEVSVVERGCIVQRGTLEELRTAPANDFVAEFVDSNRPESRLPGNA